MDGPSEKFIRGLNKKRERSWRELYGKYYVPLCNHAFKILKEKEVSKDIVQSTLVRIWENDVQFLDLRTFTAYVYRAVHNNSINYIRNKNVEDKRIKIWGEIEADMNTETFSSILEEEVIRKLKSIIDVLPNSQKQVILLTLEGFKVKEIADKMGLSSNTVKTHKNRVFKTIKDLLGTDFLIVVLLLINNRSL